MFSYKNKLDNNLKFSLEKSYYTSYRVIIKCKKFVNDMKKKIKSLKGVVLNSIDSLSIICAILTPKSINRLLEYPEIEFISLDSYAFLCGLSLKTANHINLQMPAIKSDYINIGLVDSGVYPHPDLVKPFNKLEHFVDLINNYEYPYDDNGHGTAVAGIMCGSGISSEGTYKGIVEKGSICCYKAFNSTGKGFISDILFAIESLIMDTSLNIRVLCLPFETFDNNPFILNCFESIFELAEFKNIIPIVASGSNLNLENSIKGIALCKNCLTVGGLNTTKYEIEPYNFSSSGNKNLKKPELSAACSEIRCLNSNASYVPENNGIKLYPRKLNDNYITFSGTSLACAYISGLCAILLDNTPNLTLKDLRSLITLSCNEIEYYSNDTVGEGYLDLKRFFKSIL